MGTAIINHIPCSHFPSVLIRNSGYLSFALNIRTEPQYLVEQSIQDGHNFTSLIDSYLHFFLLSS
jgi:hypothetical protein